MNKCRVPHIFAAARSNDSICCKRHIVQYKSIFLDRLRLLVYTQLLSTGLNFSGHVGVFVDSMAKTRAMKTSFFHVVC